MRRKVYRLMVCAFLATASSTVDEFDARLAEAKANEATPEWTDYQGPFFEKLVPVLRQTMVSCFPADQEPAIGTFTLLFAIQTDGRLSRFLVRPDNAKTRCVISGLRDIEVPVPPRPDWWEFLEMRVTP